MRNDVAEVRDPLLEEMFAGQATVEKNAAELHATDPALAVRYLTDHSVRCAERVVEAYWRLGDDLWTKWDEKF